MDPNQPKDQNVLSFMMQLVQEKHGDDAEMDFLNAESERLYLEFGDVLVDHFEPMLTPEQKTQFDQLINSSNDQEGVLAFLLQSIPDLEKKIMDVLMDFRSNYLASSEEAPASESESLNS